ncbi:MAG: flippase-like domain-containing protein, partial [Acidobacteria bacterium]|nr:flippase-like domain-containing protein [Acidobacteriota bacterium]MDW7983504.1 lysylphosphatidylglycerol synthase transmembrane domain-containing protein [Acidobacteriota bacterium]
MCVVGKLLLRLGVTSVLITWLFYRMDWNHFWKVVDAGRPTWLVLAFGTHFIGMSLSVLRWRLLLQALAIRLPWPAALWALMKGAFYNTFLPTAIGGDVVRIHQVSQWTRRLGVTAMTVIVERWMGLVAMFLLLGLGLFSAIGPVIVPVFLLSLASVGLPVVGYAAVYKLGQRLRRHALWARLFYKLQTVHDALMTYRRDRLTML